MRKLLAHTQRSWVLWGMMGRLMGLPCSLQSGVTHDSPRLQTSGLLSHLPYGEMNIQEVQGQTAIPAEAGVKVRVPAHHLPFLPHKAAGFQDKS